MLAYQGRFAAVMLFDVIEHLEDPRDALQRLLGSRWYYIDLLEHVPLFSAALPLRLARRARITLNLGDVTAVTAVAG